MKDTVTIVTGGAQGIGRSIAEFLASRGGDIAIFDITDGSEAVAAVQAMGRRASFYPVDVTSQQAVTEAVERVVQDFGGVHNLVNNAGITIDRLLLRMKEEDWDRVLQVNLKSAFLCTRAVVRHLMKTGGSIVNISSVVGVMGNAGQANYAASKAGVIGLTRTLALEGGFKNVTANCIAPGFIETDMVKSIPEETLKGFVKEIPLGRIGLPSDIAAVAAFLGSDDAAYVTGQTLIVSGGSRIV